jgi:hypothetical protein
MFGCCAAGTDGHARVLTRDAARFASDDTLVQFDSISQAICAAQDAMEVQTAAVFEHRVAIQVSAGKVLCDVIGVVKEFMVRCW